MNKRLLVLTGGIFCIVIAIVCRLFDLMVSQHEWFSDRADMQSHSKEDIQVRRGLITDRMGRRLAVNLEHASIFCYKNRLKIDSKSLYDKMSRFMKIQYNDFTGSFEGNRNFIWLKRKVPLVVSEKIRELEIDGLGVTPEVRRYYTFGKRASHVLGFVDIDNKGIAGVELKFNELLTDKGGKVSFVKDAKGNRLYTDAVRERKGSDIVLTIDAGLQYIVEQEIDEAVNKWKAEAATIVMMNPYTGELLSIANRPTFDPNRAGKYAMSHRRNRAITDIFEPGSTFKVIAATAVLEKKLVKPDELFDCSKGYIDVGGKRIRDSHRHEVLSFMEVIQKSSNVGTIMFTERLEREVFYNYIKLFGFGGKTGIDLPGEVNGLVRKPDRWSGVSQASAAIGHEVAVTALQMATAYSIIANGGYSVSPYIIKGTIDSNGKSESVRKTTKGERLISKESIEIVKKALVMVTDEEGTASFATVDGNTVAGKTGTAQIFNPSTGKYSHRDFVSSFIGFVPADKPKFVMIVVLWKPRGQIYGGVVAAPVFKNISEKALTYLNVPKNDKPEDALLVVMNGSNYGLRD